MSTKELPKKHLAKGILRSLRSQKGPEDTNPIGEAINKRDKKLLSTVNDAYEIIHLYMNYDGVLRKTICDDGFELANEIIDRCAVMIN